MIVECSQCRAVGRHGMVGEEASDQLLEPGPLLGDRFVHAPSQFLLDPPERCPHAIAPCCSFDKELPTAVAFTDEGKAKKVEGLRFSEPAVSASFRRKAAELDQAGLVRIERQRELLEPLAHIVPEAPGVRLVLEADDKSGGISPPGAHGTGRERRRSSGSYRPAVTPRSRGQWAKSVGARKEALRIQSSARRRCRLRRLYLAIAQRARHRFR